LSHFPRGTVHPGDVIDLAWAVPAAGIEELEVVLSIDGGERYTIRVTPELARAQSHYTWKVPGLAAAHARLCVRYGRERDEQLSAPTPEFTIASAPAPGTASALGSAWVTHADNASTWWDETDTAPAAAQEASLRGDAALVRGLAAPTTGVMPRRAPAPAALAPAATFAYDSTPALAAALAAAPVSTVPLYVPQRE